MTYSIIELNTSATESPKVPVAAFIPTIKPIITIPPIAIITLDGEWICNTSLTLSIKAVANPPMKLTTLGIPFFNPAIRPSIIYLGISFAFLRPSNHFLIALCVLSNHLIKSLNGPVNLRTAYHSLILSIIFFID